MYVVRCLEEGVTSIETNLSLNHFGSFLKWFMVYSTQLYNNDLLSV